MTKKDRFSKPVFFVFILLQGCCIADRESILLLPCLPDLRKPGFKELLGEDLRKDFMPEFR